MGKGVTGKSLVSIGPSIGKKFEEVGGGGGAAVAAAAQVITLVPLTFWVLSSTKINNC